MKSTTRKIAIIHPTMTLLGGAEMVIIQMAEAWLQKGYQVTLISAGFSSTVKAQLRQISCPYISIKVPFIHGYDTQYRNLWIMGWRLRPLLNQFDIINCHNFPANLWIAYATKFNKENCPPIIWSCHEPPRYLYEDILNNGLIHLEFDPLLDPPLIIQPENKENKEKETRHKTTLKNKDYKMVNTMLTEIIANSHFTGNHVKKIYNRAPLIQHFKGVPPEIKQENKVDKYNQNPKQILVVSRLEKLKNIHTIIKAIDHIKQKGEISPKELQITIVGSGELETALKKYTKIQKVEHYIEFVGFLSPKALEIAYKNAYCVLFVPRVEPLGLIPMEAAAYQVPTIGSNEGGPIETILPGQTGDLVDPTSTKDLAEKISHYIQNPKYVESLGRQAYQHFQKQNSFEKLIKTFERLFEAHLKK